MPFDTLREVSAQVRRVVPNASVSIYDELESPLRCTVRVSWLHRGRPTVVNHIISKDSYTNDIIFGKEMQALLQRIKEAQTFLNNADPQPKVPVTIRSALQHLDGIATWIDDPMQMPSLTVTLNNGCYTLGMLVREVRVVLEEYSRSLATRVSNEEDGGKESDFDE